MNRINWNWQELFEGKNLVCPGCTVGILNFSEDSMICQSCGKAFGFKHGSGGKGVLDIILNRHENDYNPIDDAWIDSILQFEKNHFWSILRNSFILQLVKKYLSPNASILDVGCGLGEVVSLLNSSGFNAIGLEGDLRLAEESLIRRNIPVIHMNASYVGFRNSFDAVGMFDVIEHLEDDCDALCRAAYALKENGYIFITVPAFHFLWSASDIAGGHKRRYRKNVIKTLASQAGLAIIKCGYFMMFLSPLLVISRLLQRNVPIEKAIAVQHDREIAINPVANSLLKAVGTGEKIFWSLGMPFGTSLFAILQVKPEQALK